MATSKSVMKNKYGVTCPRCGSTEIWKVGFVPTTSGRKDRFKCTVCAYTFYRGQPVKVVKSRKPRAKRAG